MWRVYPVLALLVLTAPISAQTIDGLYLINADTDFAVAGFDPIPDGATIDLTVVGTNLNVEARTTPATDFGSVVFALAGATTRNQTESLPIWALAGNNGSNFNAMAFNLGEHTLTVTAHDADSGGGNQTDLHVVGFTVVDNTTVAPTVSISSPANGATFADPGGFSLVADAADVDGSIVSVEFFVDGTQSLGVDTAAPFEMPVSGLPPGNYTYAAAATDDADITVVSEPVTVVISGAGVGPVVSGELKQWHRVSVTFDGPAATETGSPHAFLDYALAVTFTGPNGEVFVVPGFYAADGNAGVTGATGGSCWRVHFAPGATGTWSYVASFRTGPNVSTGETAGTATSFDGAQGAFVVASSDRTGKDFRAPDRGLLRNRGYHYLTFPGGTPWVKGGPDIPENFLAYDGFDNTPTNKHTYAAHEADWNPGDADWDSNNIAGATDGRRIIGALNFIAGQGGNCIYFLPMNIGGDGNDTFPTVAPQDRTHYDVSKLAQWEIVFSHAQSEGILLHFQLAETEEANENYHDDGTLGVQRKLYYRELIARFGHHNALEWDLGEENDYGHAKHIGFASYIKALDPYDHPTTTHINTNNFNVYFDKLGNGHFDKMTFQANLTGLRLTDPENEIEEWLRRSGDTCEPWMISVDEPQKIENDKTDLAIGYPHGRTTFLWPIYLSGAGGFEWYVQKDGGGHSLDQQLDDFNAMDVALQWTGHALSFLDTLPLLSMDPRKELASSTAGGTTFCLAQPGRVYALYNAVGGTFSLNLTGHTGLFQVEWFDPRNGGPFITGAVVSGGAVVSLGAPPDNPTLDWAIRVSRVVGSP